MSPSAPARSVSRFAWWARGACYAALALVSANACGGRSFKEVGGEAGETAVGGTSTVAGSSSTPGGSSSGNKPPFMDACAGPHTYTGPEGDECAAYFPRWSHDITTGVCLPVVYGGCGATKNNYETIADCQKACPGGSPNYDACETPLDCVLRTSGCCAACDGPNVSEHDFIAYNRAYDGRVTSCGGTDVACGACDDAGSVGTKKFFVPNCVAGECVVEDIRKSAVTACTASEDCTLRSGTGCCESCDRNDVVAVSADGSLDALVCGYPLVNCIPCGPTIPEGAQPDCNGEGHCEVIYLK